MEVGRFPRERTAVEVGRFPRERTGMQNGRQRAPLLGEQEKTEVGDMMLAHILFIVCLSK